MRAAIHLATGGVRPDLVLWLSVDPAEAQRRRAAARGQDRIEARGLAYQQKVHDGYRALVASDGLVEIDARQSADAITTQVWNQIAPYLAR